MARLATWSEYRRSIGDRSSLFADLVDRWPIQRALYPGSYVDLSPSTAIGSVTYVDVDARAARFFADTDLVRAELAGSAGHPAEVVFHGQDYSQPLPVPAASMDLVISLFAGPVWDSCRQYLRPGGWLLANASHGDASLAALEQTLQLVGVAHERDGDFRVDTDRLSGYLIPRRAGAADAARIRSTGRGIDYTRSAFAYVFQSG